MAESRHTNRLSRELSPYLLQHQHNPVDWYPWGEEAFAKAQREDKPVLLSVGYSACHWCHVMAHECFEDPSIARAMNAGFVCIKVDREERPDVDEVYMRVTQLISGQGGWPLTAFLTPDGDPLYGGTYFPPDDRYGRPGFPRVMQAVLDAYHNRSEETRQGVQSLLERMRLFDQVEAITDVPGREVISTATRESVGRFDPEHGGFGNAPKFPMVADQLVLLAEYRATHNRELLDRVLFTLQKMAAGGVYDQLGGGFHRYSVDPRWFAPHFEKMLYDNALVPRLYLEAFRATGERGYARIVHETLGYLLREMRSPEGGFYASQDADTEGIEGKFFVWSRQEIDEALGPERGARFAEVYGVTAEGNWEHENILHVARDAAEVATEHGLDAGDFSRQLHEDRQKLLARRDQRPRPGTDDKIIAAWNGLTLSLFSMAGSILEHPAYLDVARELGDFLLQRMCTQNGLQRIYKGEARVDGFLDDYAYVSAGLLDLHRATGESRWLEAAHRLMTALETRFGDDAGAFFLTPAASDHLPSRPISGHDQMLPSPAGVALHTLLRLGVLTGEAHFREGAEKGLRAYGKQLTQFPTGHAGLLAALDLYHRGENTCVIAGATHRHATHAMAITARKLLPLDEPVILAAEPEGIASGLLEGRPVPAEGATAFLCEGFTCHTPAVNPDQLMAQIAERALSKEGKQ